MGFDPARRALSMRRCGFCMEVAAIDRDDIVESKHSRLHQQEPHKVYKSRQLSSKTAFGDIDKNKQNRRTLCTHRQARSRIAYDYCRLYFNFSMLRNSNIDAEE